MSVAFSESILAIGYRDGLVSLWDVATWAELASHQLHQSLALGMAFSPDGQRLATGGTGHVVLLWDVAGLLQPPDARHPLRPVATLRGHARRVVSVTFSHDGQRVATASSDGTVKLWESSVAAESLILRNTTAAVGFVRNGQELLVKLRSGRLALWNVAERRESSLTVPATQLSNVVDQAAAPDGVQLACALHDGSVEIWDLQNGRLIAKRPPQGSPIRNLRFSPGGERPILAVRRWAPNTTEEALQDALSLWNLSDDKEEPIAPAGSAALTAAPEGLNFSADGHLLAFANSDRGLTVYDLTTRQPRRLDAGPVAFYGVALSADGRRLAAGQASQPRIWLWDVPTGTGEAAFLTAGDDAVRLAFHPDGKTLLVSDLDNIIRFLHLASGRELFTVMNHSPMNTLFHVSPDGNSLAMKAPASMKAVGGVELWTAPPLSEIDRQISARR